MGKLILPLGFLLNPRFRHFSRNSPKSDVALQFVNDRTVQTVDGEWRNLGSTRGSAADRSCALVWTSVHATDATRTASDSCSSCGNLQALLLVARNKNPAVYQWSRFGQGGVVLLSQSLFKNLHLIFSLVVVWKRKWKESRKSSFSIPISDFKKRNVNSSQ